MFDKTQIDGLLKELSAYDFVATSLDDFGANRIDAIAAYDRVIRSAQARQAGQIAALFAERSQQMTLGRGDAALSVIGEVGMARNVSPGAAGSQFTLALGMRDLPQVAGLFVSGVISENTARAVVRESAALGADDLLVLDAELAPRLTGLTATRAARVTRYAVIRIDAEAARTRAEANRADQRVTMFPETDGVATLHVRGPAEQITAAFHALDAWAQAQRSAGDVRTPGQIMSQTLVERVTGVAHADGLNVEIGLVMDIANLTNNGDQPVDLVGYGPIAPDLADELIGKSAKAWIRRLFTDPINGTLTRRDSRRRRFDGPLAGHIKTRDRTCRQPGCSCRIRHIDHIKSFESGGLTTSDNGQGLCIRSHTIKHQPGWKVTTQDIAAVWQTPTGHTYRSTPPPLLPRPQPGHLRQ